MFPNSYVPLPIWERIVLTGKTEQEILQDDLAELLSTMRAAGMVVSASVTVTTVKEF